MLLLANSCNFLQETTRHKHMTTMISEVYEAFLAANVPGDKARKAAEALSAESLATKSDIHEVKTELRLVKWMVGLAIIVNVIPMLRSLFG